MLIAMNPGMPGNTRGDDDRPVKADAWGLDSAESPSHVPIEPDRGAFFDDKGDLKFYPPLYRQRYETVQGILNDGRWSSPIASVRFS